MIDRLARLATHHPWLMILLFVGLAVASGSQIPSAEIDPDVKNQLPADMPARVDLDKIEKIFGGTDLLMVTLVADDVLAAKTLKRVKLLSDRIKRIDQVDRVLSLFELKDIRNEARDGSQSMVVDPAVKTIPTTAAGRERLRGSLRRNDLVFGSVVSKSFKATTIVALLNFEAQDEQSLGALQAVIDRTPGPEPLHVAGLPEVRDQVARGMRTDMRRFLPVGLLVMLVFLFLFFRQLRGMLLPFLIVVLSIVFSMGLIPLFGWKIQLITVLLPVILLAIANDYGIHLVARYQEVNRPDNTLTSRELARNVLVELARPIAIAGLTTIAGLLCLLLHLIVPAKQLGVLASIGIGYALAASLLLLPALLSLLPKAKPVLTASDTGQGKARLLERALAGLARGVARSPKKIIIGFVAISALVGVGISRVQIGTNTINYFPEDHPVRQASKIADEHFGGSTTFSVAIEGDVKHPAVLRRLDDLEHKLLAHPRVDQTTSMAKVIRQMNEVMNGDDKAHDRIPDSREAVAQLLLMYENGGDPEDFDRLVDFRYRNALLTARLNTQSTKKQAAVIRFIRDYVKQANARLAATPVAKAPSTASSEGRRAPAPPAASSPVDAGASADDGAADSDGGETDGNRGEADDDGSGSPFTMAGGEDTKPTAGNATPADKPGDPGGRFTMVGGFGVLFYDLVDAVVFGQLASLGLSLALVVLIVAVLFRSLTAGLLAGGTLGLALAFLFGLMGLLGIELNLPTALMSSIMIGVGVDYTIHFLWRYRDERRGGLEPTEAVFATLTTTGRGIIINALSVVIGFAVMLLSAFIPVRNFGFLVVVSISACLLGAMVLMPALMLLIRPRFVEPKTVPTGNAGGSNE